MKKIKYLLIFLGMTPFILIIVVVSMLVGGDSSEPIVPPATEKAAYKYMYVGSELGTPWDIVLMADAISADNKGQDGIEDYNALLTSLQFCVITEEQYEWVETPAPTAAASSPDQDALTPTPASGTWILSKTVEYTGKDQILGYIGKSETDLDYTAAASLASDVSAAAEEKSNSNTKYTTSISVNSDYKYVLSHYLKFDEDSINNILELYDSKYLVYLYGDDSTVENLTLPSITVGNVTRDELAQVAVSLMNYPYLFGGKSPRIGVPVNALDCSGYVDWVYMQCFGKCVCGTPGGTEMQFYSCSEITENELKVGDLGFYDDPATMEQGQINHVGIFIGKINGQDAFIHCGGSSFGYKDRPTGRVGISINKKGTSNAYNNITGKSFSPAMNGTDFKYFRHPQFQFADD